MKRIGIIVTCGLLWAAPADLEQARDRQDRTALEQAIAGLAEAAKKDDRADAHYRLALAESYLAEILLEQRLRNEARAAAETGIRAAQRAVELKADNAEYHRILGTLCGQIIPANVLSGLKYGRCAQEEVNKAVTLDPKSPQAYLSRAVGNYYLPPTFGGGVDVALKDIEKALQLNPKFADAWLWKGIALRKANQPAEARKAFQKALEINPNRVWAKQLLDRTPAP